MNDFEVMKINKEKYMFIIVFIYSITGFVYCSFF